MAEDIEKTLKKYDTVVDYFLWKSREETMLGRVFISPSLLDQRVTMNLTTLEGQAEIVYNVFMYRLAKWRWNMVKVNESIVLTPTPPPAFSSLLSQKERLEGMIKSGLASAAQAVADYELLKHDERKYREILDYFERAKEDEHVLRALFVDRVDAYTGEGYSMISMAKRWPTIISDFIKMKSEWKDTETIRKELKVSQAEAVVLKTKNELFKEWKARFFPDVKERYERLKVLLKSREKSIYEYRNWLKPYIAKLKVIREAPEIQPSTIDFHDPTKFAHTPSGLVSANFWIWRGCTPEEVGKPLMVSGWGEVPLYDDWVKENIPLLEQKYDLDINDKIVKNVIASATGKTHTVAHKKSVGGNVIALYPAPKIDERYIYYTLIDLDYRCEYKKASTGPMVMEDQYWDFNTFFISKNFLLFMLLELWCLEQKFNREIDEIIGISEAGREKGKEKKEDKKNLKSRLKRRLSPLGKYFIRQGPYEINIAERISKEFGTYAGAEVAELRNLIKETAYRISGQSP